MGFLKRVPDLGACEGKWITAFGKHRPCPYRASTSFAPPCGYAHRLCTACAYALECGVGTWDELADFLYGEHPAPGRRS